jgi:replication fork protection complex subunit Tof1/Swi1
MFKNAKLRLLMALVGFERLGIEDEPGATWIIPSSIPGADLDDSLKIVEKAIQDPLAEIDGYDPRAQIRRKRTEEEDAPRADFIDDSEGESNAEEEFLFPLGPRLKSRSEALDELKMKRWRRKRDEDIEGHKLDEEALGARRAAREAAALERRRKIKSEVYIHSSDDESDPEGDKEFFAKEEERRRRNERQILDALRTGKPMDDSTGKSKKRKAEGDSKKQDKRRRQSEDEDEIEIESDEDLLFISEDSPHRRKSTSSGQADDAETQTPLSSQDQPSDEDLREKGEHSHLLPTSSSPAPKAADADMKDAVTEDDEDDVVVPRPSNRVRRSLFIESDSDEE